MDISEKKLTSELKMKGIIVNVYHDKAELCDGRVVGMEVVEHPGGVTILPVDEDGMCYMVQQYRYPMQKLMLEAPAGKLEPGEDPMVCAVRELSEETGFSADEYIYLGAHATSPGYSTEILHIYLALGLHAGQVHPDEGEFLNLEKHNIQELLDMVMDNQIEDAKTVIAVLKAARILNA